EEALQRQVDLLVEHLDDARLAVGAAEDALPLAVDLLALVVHHLVVLEQVLAAVEVALLDALLGLADLPRHHRALDGLALLHAQAGQQLADPLRGEDAHQVVFEAQKEAARSRVALPAGPAPQLVVAAAGGPPRPARPLRAP